MAFPTFWESEMFDFTVCEQQNVAFFWVITWRKGGAVGPGGGGSRPQAPPADSLLYSQSTCKQTWR